MGELANLSQQTIRNTVGNMVFSKGGLAELASPGAAVRTTAAVAFSNGGLMYSKAAIASQALSGTVVPISTTAYFVLSLDASGNVTVNQGTGALPDVADSLTPFGIIKVVTNGSTTFTPGTTATNAAGVTVTFYDVSLLPATAP